MHEIGIKSSFLEAIQNGRITILCRLGKPKVMKMRIGDMLALHDDVWQNDTPKSLKPASARVIITQLLYFETLAEMLSSIDFQYALPHETSFADALQIFHQFISAPNENEYGVVAISFKLLQ